MLTPTPRFAVLLTCHNRCKNTIACLEKLYSQQFDLTFMDVYLVDDGSTDNTAEEVSRQYPKVNVISADGSLFWNRGMHLAFIHSVKVGYDFYLWLNDDTYLYPTALQSLFDTYYTTCSQKEAVVIGTTLDAQTKRISYGGYRQKSIWHPFQYQLVEPKNDVAVSCDTMCGNCVLIPQGIVDKVGLINPVYQHRWGDVDYGLRVKKAKFDLLVAPAFVGECSFNAQSNVWENRTLALSSRLKALNSIKGLHISDWKYYTKKFGGPLWFLFWLSPYLKIVLTSLLPKPSAS